jgi:hypothetical protein
VRSEITCLAPEGEGAFHHAVTSPAENDIAQLSEPLKEGRDPTGTLVALGGGGSVATTGQATRSCPKSSKNPADPEDSQWYWLRPEDVPEGFYTVQCLEGTKRDLAVALEAGHPDDYTLESWARGQYVAVVRLSGHKWQVYFRSKTLLENARALYARLSEMKATDETAGRKKPKGTRSNSGEA